MATLGWMGLDVNGYEAWPESPMCPFCLDVSMLETEHGVQCPACDAQIWLCDDPNCTGEDHESES